MITTANQYCRQIINVIKGHRVKTAFCSPGSRNAPLLLALEENHNIKKFVVVDERSAAFQALGYAQVSRKPVLLVCTSGSAVLNYAPAIAEAYYAGIPLIVVSADRPREWIDQDDSQTIRQYGILDHIVKGSFDIRAIPEGSASEFTERMMWTVNRTVNEAMIKALEGKPGPVHINVQIDEPIGALSEPIRLPKRVVSLIHQSEYLVPPVLEVLSSKAAEAKILVVAGFMAPDNGVRKALQLFASLPNVAVMAETISNLHDPQPLSTMLDAVLCDMDEEDKARMRPDIVISIGGALVSRMLKQYLRDMSPEYHWSVGHTNYFCDCFQCLTDVIDVAPEKFFRQLFFYVKKMLSSDTPDYAEQWLQLRKKSYDATEKYIADAPWSDLKAYDYILKYMDLDNLFVSNGTSVRYSQLIPHNCHAEYCNRGVSGIDGSTSTAVGGALAYKGYTTLLTGDMSWIYDSGASTLQNIDHSMRIIVMDNSGGGIFRFIKSTSSLPTETLDKYFCMKDLPNAAAIAAAHGIETLEASSMEQLEDGVDWLSEESDFPRLLVVHTPAYVSAKVLKSYFDKSK